MVQECNARVRVEEDACLEWLPVSVKMRRKSHWIGVTFYIPHHAHCANAGGRDFILLPTSRCRYGTWREVGEEWLAGRLNQQSAKEPAEARPVSITLWRDTSSSRASSSSAWPILGEQTLCAVICPNRGKRCD